jgi:hypothetical protein
MNFQFSIGEALKRAWHIYKKHVWFFLGIALVMLILNIASHEREHHFIMQMIIVVAGVVWSYVGISVSLAAVDGKDDLLHFGAIKSHFPTYRLLAKYVIVGVATGLIFLAGLVLLIIPGIYFLVRLTFSKLAIIDRKGSVKQSLRYSWYLVKKDVFWTVFLTVIVSLLLILVGALTVVGLLVTYPLAFLMVALLYRALGKREQASVVEQLLELEPTVE